METLGFKDRTRGGDRVMYVFNAPNNSPSARIIALIEDTEGDIIAEEFYSSGKYWIGTETDMDLMPLKETKEK